MAKRNVRGAKMPRALGHSIGAMGRPHMTATKATVRGAHAVPSKAVPTKGK